MNDLISEVRTRGEFEDGQTFDEFVRWDGVSTSFEEQKRNMIYAQEHKVIGVRKALLLDSGVEVDVPINDPLNILPDRTGVLVVFGQTPSKFGGHKAPWFFGFPNNAAIYNADGSLRFQLDTHAGQGSYIGAIHGRVISDNPETLGVLVGTVGHDPEWLYLVDPSSPKLIPTGKWIRY
ncbi:hypothetical protein [Pseudomonas fluorescens]|uniref:Uncharacterized protein n=1 Tax=Pseudomonas fluorescens TaxID=294 RepID=A0A5E6PD84_PSEFL|nr:hypothetical protein [Pseudomonas fluorescens]VVM41358.1 hypothetical protein PS624_00293 [Pseudomonas fluorescens]